jgi:DNA (cytosine-5)-methyltransferase 1
MAGKRNPDDPRNQLYKYTIDIIKRVKPKIFVLENVKGILSFKERDGELVINKIQKMLLAYGYYSKLFLADASKFGVPQKRERVIFIGSLIKNKKKVDKVIDILKNHNEKNKTVKDAIYDLRETKNMPNHTLTKHSDEFINKIKITPQGQCVLKKFSDAFKRCH